MFRIDARGRVQQALALYYLFVYLFKASYSSPLVAQSSSAVNNTRTMFLKKHHRRDDRQKLL